jgi:uncharacterized membrane protein HdeD (DUF308 family)
MVAQLARNWWAVALRGAAAVLFGLAAFLWPGLTLALVVLLWGAYALVDGVFAVAAAVTSAGDSERWWTLLLQGIAGIAAGVLTFFWPGITAVALLYVVAAWALITGALEIAAAIRLRRDIDGESLLALSGVLSIILAVVLFVAPGAGALAFVWMLGSYAIVAGVVLIALAFRLRRFGEQMRTRAAA